ncbi:lytic murein transglycosylase [Rhizobium sp. SEMIA 4032]|nr:lytic murein transglycosylase [Rhizobium sp. SEMIA 4032]
MRFIRLFGRFRIETRRVRLHPPLPCRASPPQGGRSTSGYISSSCEAEYGAIDSVLLISPLEGEMSGRTEGG